MKAFLIEDETMAREQLARTLRENFPDIEIAGTAASVREAVTWLRTGRPDIIFMDVELSDGQCFEIFKKTEVHGHVVMTTAYDNYAIKAFEAGSIDYLLKPIELPALRRAVERCRQSGMPAMDVDQLIRTLSARTQTAEPWKERWLVHFNDRIVPVCRRQLPGYHHHGTRPGAVFPDLPQLHRRQGIRRKHHQTLRRTPVGFPSRPCKTAGRRP